ncbi:RNA-binding cell elongation regulator Jag/EloR [Thermicanus aegyptius]|uniref:RNA-binding cell elongation regulator Jag/EloR n=1 Tax=Thermicanus aegyptius TaxID=94009 RepID=UPI0003F65C47|nr:RNA-binding cell elongation regulator Jag/EloR [Thermicanus aegyptius]
MDKMIFFGKTVEEAVERGLQEMKVTKEKVVIKVLEEPVKGLFGILGSKPAKVELERIVDPIEEGKNFLMNVIEKMGMKVDIEVFHRKEAVYFNLVGDRLGVLIGHHGQTLDALQYLVNAVAGRYAKGKERIILDAENYRAKRKESLEELAERVARKVLKTKESVKLEPMNANERRIIHTHLQNEPHILTVSEGEEPYRSVVIHYKE